MLKKKTVLIISLINIILLSYITVIKISIQMGASTITMVYAIGLLSISNIVLLFFSKVKYKFNVIDILVSILFIYTLLNIYFISSVPVLGKLIKMILLLLLYFNLRILLSFSKNIFYYLSIILILTGSYEAFLGMQQLFGVSYNVSKTAIVSGTFFNSGPYSLYLTIVFSISLAYVYSNYTKFIYVVNNNKKSTFTSTKNINLIFSYILKLLKHPWVRYYFYSSIGLLFTFLILPATLSRAAFISCFIVLLALMINHKHYKKLLVTLSLVLILGVLLYYLKSGSANARLLIWQVSFNAMINNWLSGVGYGGFVQAYAENQSLFFQNNPTSYLLKIAGCPEFAFNEYLKIGVELGIFGLLIFITLLVISLIKLYHDKQKWFYGLISLMVFSFFSYPLSLLPYQIIFIFFIAKSANSTTKNYFTKNKFILLIIPILSIIVAINILPYIKNKVNAINEYNMIKNNLNIEYYNGIDEDYQELYTYLYDNPRFLFSYGKALNGLQNYNKSNSILFEGAKLSSDPMFYNVIGNNYKKLGAYQLAEKYYKKAFDILPNRIYPLYLLMNLYVKTNNTQKALYMKNKVISFKPKIESKATNDMKKEAEELIVK